MEHVSPSLWYLIPCKRLHIIWMIYCTNGLCCVCAHQCLYPICVEVKSNWTVTNLYFLLSVWHSWRHMKFDMGNGMSLTFDCSENVKKYTCIISIWFVAGWGLLHKRPLDGALYSRIGVSSGPFFRAGKNWRGGPHIDMSWFELAWIRNTMWIHTIENIVMLHLDFSITFLSM